MVVVFGLDVILELKHVFLIDHSSNLINSKSSTLLK